jgi:two-component system nitrogen regulation sensor histidine kinase NtrY
MRLRFSISGQKAAADKSEPEAAPDDEPKIKTATGN